MALEEVGFTEPVNVYSADVFVPPSEIAVVTPQVELNSVSLNTRGSANLAGFAAKGIAGLKIDWMASPMISLQTDGMFEDARGKNYGKNFNFKVIETKAKYSHSFKGSQNPKTELAYSYDQVHTTNGGLVAEHEEKLRAMGKNPETKQYLEIFAELISSDENEDGDFRTIQVSPTSVSAFTMYVFKLSRRNKEVTDVVTTASVGEKIKFDGGNYYPWVFSEMK